MIRGKDMRRAYNGTGGNVQLGGKNVFYDTLSSTLNIYDKSNLGTLMNKSNWIKQRMIIVSDGKRIVGDQLKERLSKIEDLMKSWYLYENGWFYSPKQRDNGKSRAMFLYLCEIGNNYKPEEMDWFKWIGKSKY